MNPYGWTAVGAGLVVAVDLARWIGRQIATTRDALADLDDAEAEADELAPWRDLWREHYPKSDQ